MPPFDLQHTSTEDEKGGYHLLASLLLVPLACAAVIAGWVLYAMLAIAAGEGYPDALPTSTFALPIAIGAVVMWPAYGLSKHMHACWLIQALLALQSIALAWLGAAQQPWEFVVVALGLGIVGGVISASVAHIRERTPQHWGGLVVGLHVALLAGGGLSWLLVPMVSQAYGWRVTAWSLMLPVAIVMLLLWLFVDPAEIRAASR
ncbi:hypothetical protein [Halomonas llamarensis]|uniref:MFS transporter n=1 Tax=Halomonas llamarensis TaxID=2945104 RepID=A0ABT0SUY3_9GAMM|nr:hypothetical protein [Halomonas llamarensis]MCL7931643.1 hypothetical protein [Halomonas llamarensis]